MTHSTGASGAGLRTVGGCLLDLDGTVYQGSQAIAGVGEALSRLRQAAVPYRFVTNTTRKPRREIVAHLSDLGLDVREEDCLTAPTAAAAWLKARRAERILPLLRSTTLEDLTDFAVDRESPEYVLVGDLGEEWSFQILDEAFRALMQGAELVAIQKNRYWRRQDSLSLDAGAFVTALEFASGKEAHLVGKPSTDFFLIATTLMGLPPSQVLMVGDDLESDVAGAKRAGLRAIAVRTGKYRPEDEAEARRVSDAVLDSVADLPDWLLVAA